MPESPQSWEVYRGFLRITLCTGIARDRRLKSRGYNNPSLINSW
ncbi:MAG: hypothetical protein ACKO4S_05165 [Snowella sp.]